MVTLTGPIAARYARYPRRKSLGVALTGDRNAGTAPARGVPAVQGWCDQREERPSGNAGLHNVRQDHARPGTSSALPTAPRTSWAKNSSASPLGAVTSDEITKGDLKETRLRARFDHLQHEDRQAEGDGGNERLFRPFSHASKRGGVGACRSPDVTCTLAVAAAVRSTPGRRNTLVLGAALGGHWASPISVRPVRFAFAIDESYRGRVGTRRGVGRRCRRHHCWRIDRSWFALIVAVAMVAAAISGLVGAAGPHGPAFGMILQYRCGVWAVRRIDLTPVTQAAWYLVGVAAVGLAQVVDWPFRRGVFATTHRFQTYSPRLRTRVRQSWSARRTGGPVTPVDGRVHGGATAGWSPMTAGVSHPLRRSTPNSDPMPREVVNSLRCVNRSCAARRWRCRSLASRPAGLRALAAALDGSGADESARNGRRIGDSCPDADADSRPQRRAYGPVSRYRDGNHRMAVHDPHHSFWLPMTVSVMVRPGTSIVRADNQSRGGHHRRRLSCRCRDLHLAPAGSLWPASLGLGSLR